MSRRSTAAAAVLLALALSGLCRPASAATPDAPTLVAPADQSTSSTADVPLAVRASDPDGDALDVRLEGRKVGATVPGAGSGSPFTVVALPDTQNYTYSGRQGAITAQARWAVDNRARLGTAMVVQLGDLVSNYDRLNQWDLTSAGLKVLDDAGMPNTVVAGNHDFDTATGAFTQYDSYFPPTRYSGATWTPSTARYGGYLGQNLFGPDPVDQRNMDSFALFSAGGRDFLVLNLEWEAPQPALDWASKVLAAYPDRTAIMVTHSFVGLTGQRRAVAERPGGTSPERLWTDFVSQQCSIKLVLNGHYHSGDVGEANRSDLNRCGQPVQQVLTDYQDRANGGDGWLRYYTFDPAASTMTATTYSPTLQRFETDADSSFTVPFDLGAAPQPAPFTTIATSRVASGDVARATWTGLAPDTAYEWRAVADDGTTTSTSSTWTVRTPASTDLVTDDFTRDVSNGWGAADGSHAWQLSGSPTAYRVGAGAGRVTSPAGSSRTTSLTGVSAADARVDADLSLDQAASGSGAYASVLGRVRATGTAYRAKLRYLAGGSLTLSLGRTLSGAETTFATAPLTGLTAAPGVPLRVRLEVSGTSPTMLRAKAWAPSATEPATWTLTTTDTTAALQTAGGAGLELYTSSGATGPATLALDRFSVSGPSVPPANQKPVAVIATPQTTGRSVDLSAAGSSDPDGTIVGQAWDFGDGATATGPTTSHTYAADGTFTVTLVVTDDQGATAQTTRQVNVAAPANQKPVAVIATPQTTGRSVDLSATGSSDPDGTIVGQAWDFGDGATATEPTTSHTYAADGTFTVTLVVTDDQGATAQTTRQVSVAAPAPTGTSARDGFDRTTTGGWGSADVGGAWTTTGTASRYAVSGGVGRQVLTAPGSSADAALASVSSSATELRATLAWSRTAAAGTLYAHVLPRRVSSTTDYRCRVIGYANGTTQLLLARRVGGTETTLATTTVKGLNVTQDQTYRIACRATPSGTSTVLAGKVWRTGTSEPADWSTTTDGTAALQVAGGIGVGTYESGSATAGVTTTVDDLLATTP